MRTTQLQAVRRKEKSKSAAASFLQPWLEVFAWAGLNSKATGVFLTLLCAVLVSGLLVVKTTHQNRFTFNDLQELKDAAVELDVAWGQLLIEQSTFGVEGRIEQKAVEQLEMRIPTMSDIVMVGHD